MTIDDLCDLLGKSKNTMTAHFKRTKETLEKRGIIISKDGKEPYADYTVTFPDGTRME